MRTRRKKNERKDFQKVKFKVGKKKPVGLNATDTTFKSKGVTILAQFQTSTEAVTSARGVGIKEICSLLSHRVVGQRAFAFNELSDYLDRYGSQMVDHLGDLLNAILPRLMDEDERNRNRCCHALSSIFRTFGENAKSILEPFASLIINYIICALTHVNVAIATQSLQAVDIITEFLPLKNVVDEAAKLLQALMSMISSSEEHQTSQSNQKKKKKATLRLLSVGHFATKQARVLVLVRVLSVVKSACSVEGKEGKELSGGEIVLWNVATPTAFVLRSHLPLDMELRPVVWPSLTGQSSASVGGSSAMKNESPQEKLTTTLLYLIKFISIFWPTVADQFGESTVTFEDLAGRRCCQDLLKNVLLFFRHLFLDEEKFDINSLSESLLEAIKSVTGQNPLSQMSLAASKGTPKGFYKHIHAFTALVLPGGGSGGQGGRGSEGGRGGTLGVDLLNTNALSLLKVYRQFVTDTRGSQQLLTKLNCEVTKLEKHLATLADASKNTRQSKKAKHFESVFESSENVQLFDYSKHLKEARLEMILLDHPYFAEVPKVPEVLEVPEVSVGDGDVPSPLRDAPDVILY